MSPSGSKEFSALIMAGDEENFGTLTVSPASATGHKFDSITTLTVSCDVQKPSLTCNSKLYPVSVSRLVGLITFGLFVFPSTIVNPSREAQL